MARRPKRPEHENHERWLISYADFITLLFAFFVVMYAISAVNIEKYKVFSEALTTAFGKQGTTRQEASESGGEQDTLLKSLVDRRNARLLERMRKQQEYMQGVASDFGQAMAAQIASGLVSITRTSRGVVLEINASALFNQGEAELQSGSIKTMARVAQILGQGDQSIEVEGYTDDTPIRNARFPSNWELSSARASSVVRLFIEHGVAASRLTAVGSAANRPIVSNDTAEGRARNRRVTVTVLSPAVEPPAQ
ncbi:MAG: flagellar motor protein MotD [Nitrosomonadales bacterium]|nr:flagellar motor protein MotD [Nitrosomonadales bacterium]